MSTTAWSCWMSDSQKKQCRLNALSTHNIINIHLSTNDSCDPVIYANVYYHEEEWNQYVCKTCYIETAELLTFRSIEGKANTTFY